MEKLYGGRKHLVSPTGVGAENIPKGPVLFVANHSTMAADVLVLAPVLQRASGRFVRGMSDEFMYRNARIRNVIAGAGAVMGHQQVGTALLQAGKDLLVFPGGAHEANKDLDERYQLKWKGRTGFIRLAAAQGIPIVPVGIVGPDEWFGRYMDRDEVADSWLGKMMTWLGASEEFMNSDQLPPIPKGMFGSVVIPRPQRVYISIGKAVSTSRFRGKTIGEKSQVNMRDKVEQSLEQCIADMLLLQAQDKESLGLVRRLLSL
jgi:1-acyl-sn-glycerol-3-phosphate acyltransferase